MNEAWAVAKTNQMILKMNIVICGTLTGGYVLDVLKGRKTIIFVAIFLAVIAVNLVLSLRVYLKNKASSLYKYYSIIGCMLIYCYAMFSSDTYFTFVFIYPMSVLFSLYFDTKLMKYIGIATIILNVVKIAYQILNGHSGSTDITSYTVQIALAILISAGMYTVVDLTVKLNNEKIAKIREANILADNMDYLHENLNEQAQRSEDIVQTTDEIKTLSENMTAIAKHLLSTLSVGIENVKKLNEENEKVNKSTELVHAGIENLRKLANDITKIIKIISDIALKTNILALNASIEATRASEHNKGFMAVSDEVKELALQSENSAKQINEIIKVLLAKIFQTLEEVGYMMENNVAQNGAITIVRTTFLDIKQEINSLSESIQTLDSELTNLSESNRDVSTSTQKIAALASQSQNNSISQIM